MSNVKLSKRGREVLRNSDLSRAIVWAIVNGPYTPDGNGAIVKYDGNEFIINFWPREAKMEFQKNAE